MTAQMIVEYIENEFGPIGVLVNCAGAAKRTPVAELHADAMHASMQAKPLASYVGDGDSDGCREDWGDLN
ncbi:hypothetical protein [Dyella sp. Tek66A03]|uniref:hypothetical protein n=1 Tax=Dyella sp. Tek66A03 TaxID=3458298 RepID=UPI00403EDC37